MKPEYLIKPRVIVFLFVLLIGCGGDSDSENSLEKVVPAEPDPIVRGLTSSDQEVYEAVDLDTSGSVINISIIDASTQNLLMAPVNLVVTDLSGENALKVEGEIPEPDTANEETYSFFVENAVTTLELDDDLNNDQITLRIQAFADGYITNGQSITVESTGEVGAIELMMVSTNNLPNFVGSVTDNVSYINGELSENVMISSSSTNPSTGQESTFSFELPESSLLVDSNGDFLNDGNLNVAVSYFDPQNPNAAEIFPGGLMFDEDAVGADGAGEFITAGLMNIQITDDAGNQVSQLGTEGGTITVTVPSDLVNPVTQEFIKAGDVIPLWSRDDQTGKWVRENSATVTMNDKGELELSSQITHLTSYNYDWFGTGYCSSRKLSLSNAQTKPPYLVMPFYVSITNEELGYKSGLKRPYYDSDNTVYNTPPSVSSWSVYDSYTSEQPIATKMVSECADVTFDLDFAYPEPQFELILKSPAIVAPFAVTYREVEALLKQADVNRADREAILEISHPGSMPELSYVSYYTNYSAYVARYQRVSIASLYQRFLDEELLNRDDIATIQSIIAMQFQLDGGEIYYRLSSSNRLSSSGYIDVKDIPAEGISIPQVIESGRLYLYTSGYIIDSDGVKNYFYGSQSRDIDLSVDQQSNAEIQSVFALSLIYEALIDSLEQ